MDADLVASLEVMLDDARSGEIVGLFVVTRSADGEYSCCYQTEDLDDLLLQVRTEVIRAQVDIAAADQRLN